MKTTINKNSSFHALVLGGTGFIGSALLDTLQNKNHPVTCLTHKRTCKQDIRTVSGSILTFPWSRLETTGMPDVIFHLARIPGKGPASRLAAALASRMANYRLLHWLNTLDSPPLLVLVAGTLAYGDHGADPVDETTPLRPLAYARQYSIGEQPIIREMLKKKLPIMVMRPAWVYGNQSWFKSFYLEPMKTHKVVPLYGDGENIMSLIHVQDVAGLLIHIVTYGEPNQAYNLFTFSAQRQKEFAGILSKLSGLDIQSVDRKKLRRQGGRTLVEALTFSLHCSTQHHRLYSQYQPAIPDLKTGISSILTSWEL